MNNDDFEKEFFNWLEGTAMGSLAEDHCMTLEACFNSRSITQQFYYLSMFMKELGV